MNRSVLETQRQKRGIRRFDLAAAIAVSLVAGFSAGKLWQMRTVSAPAVVDWFHQIYFGSGVYDKTTWLGTHVQKLPSDLWAYQEILWERRPDVILEMGTYKGGSARFIASIMDLLGHGRIITVDIKAQPNRPVHPRITYLLGSSTSDEISRQIRELVRPGEAVMVLLDSDHRRDHVLREMQIYGPMVTPGNYMIVEDTNLNGHPVDPDWGGPGPFEAVEQFMKGNRDFARPPAACTPTTRRRWR